MAYRICLLLAWMTSFALAAPTTAPAGFGPRKLPGQWGVNIHFTKPQPGEMKMLADAGVSIVRMDFSWAGTERKPGEYDFSAYDGLMGELDRVGIRALFILDYGNKLYDAGLSPHTDAGRAAFAKWAGAAASHFAGRQIIWEIWNEPNHGQFWKPRPSADDYARLAIAAGRAVRQADPSATIIGPATSTIDLPFLEACFKAGCLDVWDAVSVHPYRQSEPETVAAELYELELLKAHYERRDRNIPVYSGEWGYSSAWRNHDADRQARYLPRQWLTNLVQGVKLSIWYDWRDDGTDPKEAEHHFGTVGARYRPDHPEQPFEPKPAYRAMKLITDQLAGYEYCHRVATGAFHTDYVLLFARRDDKGLVTDVKLVGWTTANEPRLVDVDCSPGTFTAVRSPDGARSSLKTEGIKLELTLTQDVQYISADRGADGSINRTLLLAAGWKAAPMVYTSGGCRPCVRFDYQNGTPQNVAITIEKVRLVQFPKTIGSLKESGIYGRGGFDVTRHAEPQVYPYTLTVNDRRASTQWVIHSAMSVLHVDVLEVKQRVAMIRVQLENRGSPLYSDIKFKGVVGVEAASKTEWPIAGTPGKAFSARDVEVTPEHPVDIVKLAVPDNGLFAVRAMLSYGNTQYGCHFSDVAAYRSIPLGEADKPAFKPIADGDRKVNSEQAIRLAQPAAGALAEGLPAMELSYRFDAGHKFVQAMPANDEARALPGKPSELRMWVYGDGSGNQLRMRFAGADGQVFQPDFGRLTWTGWKRVTFRLTGEATAHWAGNNDGVVRYPIRLDSLLLIDSFDRKATGGTVYVSGVVAVE